MPNTVIRIQNDIIKILGTYTTHLLSIEYIFLDISKIKEDNKNSDYEALIINDHQINLIKKRTGYLYNTKEYTVYHIIEVTENIIES